MCILMVVVHAFNIAKFKGVSCEVKGAATSTKEAEASLGLSKLASLWRAIQRSERLN